LDISAAALCLLKPETLDLQLGQVVKTPKELAGQLSAA
jgi:hypothetical protein